MRRNCSALLLTAVLGGCGGPLEVSVQIQRGEGMAEADVRSLQSFTITIENDVPVIDRVTIEVTPDEQRDLGPLKVDRTRPFTVDVWACRELVCDDLDVDFRDCDGPFDARDRVEALIVPIRLRPVADVTECD
jgi:hypothetical protein